MKKRVRVLITDTTGKSLLYAVGELEGFDMTKKGISPYSLIERFSIILNKANVRQVKGELDEYELQLKEVKVIMGEK